MFEFGILYVFIGGVSLLAAALLMGFLVCEFDSSDGEPHEDYEDHVDLCECVAKEVVGTPQPGETISLFMDMGETHED